MSGKGKDGGKHPTRDGFGQDSRTPERGSPDNKIEKKDDGTVRNSEPPPDRSKKGGG